MVTNERMTLALTFTFEGDARQWAENMQRYREKYSRTSGDEDDGDAALLIGEAVTNWDSEAMLDGMVVRAGLVVLGVEASP